MRAGKWFAIALLVCMVAAMRPAPANAEDCCAIFAPGPIPTLSAGQIIFVPVTVTNTGDVTWLGYGSTQFGLSYFLYDANNMLSPAAFGPGQLFAHDVAKGQTTTVTVRLQAPATAGIYTVRWYIAAADNLLPIVRTTFDQTISVGPWMGHLQALLSILATIPGQDPLIVAIASSSSTEVRGRVVIGGENFGTSVGKINLVLQDRVVSAIPTWWTDNRVEGEFGVSGESDQPAILQVIRADDVKSNEWPVKFLATLDYRPLPAELIQVQCASTWGTTDQCEQTKDNYLAGYHSSDCCVTGDNGSDTYFLPSLRNGWVYEFLDFNFNQNATTGMASPSGFTPGAAGHTVRVNWGMPLHEIVSYSLIPYIRGPNGVPFQ
jgi:hypothetical protein